MKFFQEYRGLRKENYILVLGRLVTSMGSMVWPMMTLILRVKMKMSPTAIATLIMVAVLASAPLNLIGGKLADHFIRKNIIIICDTISVFGFLFCAFHALDYTALAVFIVAGLLQGMEGPAYSALVADLVSSKDRERAYSLQYLANNIGLIMAPMIGGLLFAEHLPLLFLINAMAIATSTIIIAGGLRNVKNTDDLTGDQYEKPDRSGTIRILRKYPILLLYFLISGMSWAIYSQYTYLMPLDLVSVHGAKGAVLFGTMSSINCIVVVICTPLITRLFSPLHEPSKMILGQICELSGYALFMFGKAELIMSDLAIIVFTWGEIFLTLSGDPYLSRRIPSSHRGRLLGIGALASTFMYAMIQPLVGFLYDTQGSTETWIVLLSLLLVLLMLTLILRRLDQRVYPKFYTS